MLPYCLLPYVISIQSISSLYIAAPNGTKTWQIIYGRVNVRPRANAEVGSHLKAAAYA